MKAWKLERYGSPKDLALVDSATPAPGAGEVLVRIRAVSLNYRDLINLETARPGNLVPPVVPCSDGAGEVVAVGTGVTAWQAGDRVAGTFFQEWLTGPFAMIYHAGALGGSAPGMLAQEVMLSAEGLVRLPEHLSFEEGACLPCAAVTAWQALFRRGGLQAGAKVLALGTGGVSVFALQLATAAGAEVFITSSSDAKLDRARQMGAAHTVNYRTTPEWGKEVWRLTAKRGVDHVVEVGGPGTLGQSLSTVAPGGQVALIGVLTGFDPPDASLFPLVARNARLDGIYVGSREDFEALNAFLTEHRIKPVIDRVFEFAEAPAAFDHLRSGAHFGKVVVRVD
jgi:NADPH:quinone reductase-like Zn-dependent oxidoreductase